MMGDPFFTARARTARKPRRCSNGHAIQLGDRYIEHKEFPDWLADIVVPKEEYRP